MTKTNWTTKCVFCSTDQLSTMSPAFLCLNNNQSDQKFSKNDAKPLSMGFYRKINNVKVFGWLRFLKNAAIFDDLCEIYQSSKSLMFALKKALFRVCVRKLSVLEIHFFASTNSKYDAKKVKIITLAKLGRDRRLNFDAKTKMVKTWRFWVCARNVSIRLTLLKICTNSKFYTHRAHPIQSFSETSSGRYHKLKIGNQYVKNP